MSMPTWLRAHGSSRGKESNLRLTAERKELGILEASGGGWVVGAGERKVSGKKNIKVGFEQLILPENETRGH